MTNNAVQVDIEKSISKYQNIILSDITSLIRIPHISDEFYTTQLIDWEGTKITFYAPISLSEYVLYSKGTRLDIQFICKSGCYFSQVTILQEIRLNGNIQYVAKITKTLVRRQLREYFRLSTLLDLKFTLSDHEHEENISCQYNGIAVNISAGGLCMLSSQKLNTSDTIQIYLDFLEHHIEVKGRILMVDQPNAVGNFTYRIKFIELSPKTQNLINKLIFEKQRIERSLERDR